MKKEEQEEAAVAIYAKEEVERSFLRRNENQAPKAPRCDGQVFPLLAVSRGFVAAPRRC